LGKTKNASSDIGEANHVLWMLLTAYGIEPNEEKFNDLCAFIQNANDIGISALYSHPHYKKLKKRIYQLFRESGKTAFTQALVEDAMLS